MRTTAYGLAMALCAVIAAGGCSEQKKNDPMADIYTSGASQRILDYINMILKKGKAKDVKTRDVIDDIAMVTNRIVRGRLYKIVEERLFSIDLDIMPKSFYGQSPRMRGVWNSANYLAQNMVDTPQEERWRIRLRALEWVRDQVSRIEKNEPPDVDEPVERKMIPVKVGNKVEYYPQVIAHSKNFHLEWRMLLKYARSFFSKSSPVYLTHRLERDIDDDDLRARLQKRMEEILGRPLTDDDFGPRETIEVLRLKRAERKRRAQKEGGTGINGN